MMCRLLTSVVMCGLMMGCGDNTPNKPTTDTHVPSSDAAQDSEALGDTISSALMVQDALSCKTPGVNTNNNQPLKRVLLSLDDYPDARCNDGSPGAMYIREAANPDSATRWLFHLQGGGGCVDYQTCLDRWCGNTAQYDASRMSTNYGPLSRDDAGIMDRDVEGNTFADANIVFVYYCSSDGHQGEQNDVVMQDPNDPSNGFRLHMRGHSVMEAIVGSLMAGETTSDDGSVTLPSLSEATQILFTGTSGGSAGAASHLDWLAEQVGGAVDVMGVFDASFYADISKVDDPVILDQWDAHLTATYTASTAINMFQDASCESVHSDDPKQCVDPIHVRLHHITTPYFVRHDMGDPKAIAKLTALNPDLAPEKIAAWNRETLLMLPALMMTAEEKASMTRTPGVFAQACAQHVGLTNHNYVFEATIEEGDGETTFAQALARWIEGEDVALISELPPASTSTCPPTSGELD